jgi:hypothetical protein
MLHSRETDVLGCRQSLWSEVTPGKSLLAGEADLLRLCSIARCFTVPFLRQELFLCGQIVRDQMADA